MPNPWRASVDPVATWSADLHALASHPERLLDVVVALVEAGERHQVLSFQSIPLLGWDRARDAPLVEVLRAQAERPGALGQRIVDAFAFTGATLDGRPGTATVGAHLDGLDGVTISLDPQAPDARRRPPMTVCGRRFILLGAPARLSRPLPWPGMVLRFMTFTDGWWTSSDSARRQLDGFLADADAAVTGRGGRWSAERATPGPPPGDGSYVARSPDAR